MGAINKSLQNKINSNNLTRFSETTGTILAYDRTTETCKVKYPNPHGEGFIYRGNVDIVNTNGGMSTDGIFPGQKCSISFINDNLYTPVIVGIQNCYYAERNCTDQGAYLADDDIWKVGTPENIIAMNLDWINSDNADLSKYENNSARYTNVDVNERSLELMTTLDKYSDSEIGMTNLITKSTIKLRENGDIDIFTSANTGMRICDNTGNIKFYGNDIEFTKSTGESDKTDHSIATQLKVAQIMKICLAYDIIKEVDEYVSMINESLEGSTDLNGDLS